MKALTFARIKLFDHGVSLFIFYFLVLLLLPPIANGQTGPSRDSPDGSSFGPIVSRKTSISFIILISVFFLIGLFTVYVRHCIGNRRRSGGFPVDQETAGGRSTMAAQGLDKAAIASFPTFAYSSIKQLKIGKGSLECAVCLNEFADYERLRLLPKCSHVFHSDCVDAWLTSHSTCPLCRDILVPVTADGSLSFSLPVQSDHESSAGGAGDRSLPNESDNRAAIHVAENTNPNQTSSNLIPLPHRPVRSRSTGWRFNEIFLRSHTTDHSLVQPIENYERFTLRLPDKVRSELLNSTVSLNRARSCVGLGGMQSSRQGPRTGSGSGKNLIFPTNQIDWLRFFLKNGSGISQNSEFRVDEEAGERSFSRLRPPGDVQS